MIIHTSTVNNQCKYKEHVKSHQYQLNTLSTAPVDKRDMQIGAIVACSAPCHLVHFPWCNLRLSLDHSFIRFSSVTAGEVPNQLCQNGLLDLLPSGKEPLETGLKKGRHFQEILSR